ncbi:hypothetical protein GDO86_016443 [Hymenochirus boettgeri]|uniref:G-protein coupled receptors family 3 profile domain-containing protein n=1 Tax=Hymenochirus boettgeri TaxID=247094 RepID=A0A8T2K1A3_9PIPI|nr:hypothetical protein GDO86_016443 [Hymenochirus boettgeri]
MTLGYSVLLKNGRASVHYTQHLLAFIYAIEEINASDKILPNISLGYTIYDACSNEVIALDKVLKIISESGEATPNYICQKRQKSVAIIGHFQSSATHVIAQITQLYRYPQISYGAMDPVFNDRNLFPTLYRMVPDEYSQFDSIIQLLIHFNWNWVGIITTDDISNQKASLELEKEMMNHGICVEFIFDLPNKDSIKTTNQFIKTTTANVIVLYFTYIDLLNFLLKDNQNPISKKVLVASVTLQIVSDYGYLSLLPALNGSLLIMVPKGEIPGFSLTDFEWEKMKDKNYVKDFFINIHCSDFLFSNGSHNNPNCLWVTQWQKYALKEESNNYYITAVIYNTVHLLAQALHQMHVDQLLFEKDSKHLAAKNKFKTPLSLCGWFCPTGYRKSLLLGKHLCCYDCIPCSEGEIANSTDSENCLLCPEDHWSNPRKDLCVKKTIDFLSYGNYLGRALSAVAIIFSLITIGILCLFVIHQKSPIVKANNRHLSYILLVSLILSFCCSFLFIGRPVQVTCILRQVTFLVTYTVAISSVLGKTLTVIIAFRATKPGSKLRNWMGYKVSFGLVIICSSGKLVICITWLIWATPFTELDTKTAQQIMTLQCNEGSIVMFYLAVSYIAVLSLLCFIVAFMARKLPDRYNEAQYITFSMLVFCSVWVSFIPTYLSTKGKYMVAVEIFTILSSAAGLLFCIFLPKCYIILLKCEQNTRSHKQ